MAIVINGSGSISGISVGGLPDGSVDAGTLATDSVSAVKIAANSVDSAELIDGAIDGSHLASGVGALSSQYVSFTRNSASGAGTQAITGVGFQPTAVLFLAAISGAGMASIGFQDSDKAGDSLADRQLMTANDWDTNVWNTDKINIVFASTVNYGGSITAYGSDGFTITWAVRGSPSGTVKIRALCFK
tara:strand:+ start:40 stop:603 length:564 start_codon:yes stop_codon:yes gene_type:complete